MENIKEMLTDYGLDDAPETALEENLPENPEEAAEEPGAKENEEANEELNEELNEEVNEAAGAEETLPPAEQLARLAAAYGALEQQKQELEGQMLRLQADFDNFRRRTRAEKEEWQQNNTAAFCGELLPVIDNFGRALQALKASEADPGHLAGVEMIARQLAELLAAKGVERIPALGEEFDPNWHEAIGQTVVEDEALVGKVTEEIQAGYRLGNKLLRVAMVHVGTK